MVKSMLNVKKIRLSVFIIFYVSISLFAFEYEWIRQFGSGSSDHANSTTIDNSSNVYVAGYTDGTLPGQTSSGNMDAFIRKYSNSGSEQWTRQFGASGDDRANSITTDSSGNVYVAGDTDGTLPGQGSSGNRDAFIKKYDSSGTEQWTRQFGGLYDDVAYTISIDTSGNIYVAGWIGDTLPGQSPDAYIRKYDSSGNIVWIRQFGFWNGDYAYNMIIDSSGNIYVAGYTDGTLPGQTSSGNRDAFIVKYNSSGTEQWKRQFGTSSSDGAYTITTDSSSNIYVAGETGGTFSGQTSSGTDNNDAFIRKYDSSGTEQWTRQFGTSSGDSVQSITKDGSWNIYVAGNTQGTLSGQTSSGTTDVFIRKYDSSGTELLTRQFGTSSGDSVSSITTDGLSNIYVAGYTGGTLPGQTSSGSNDVFIIKLDYISPMAITSLSTTLDIWKIKLTWISPGDDWTIGNIENGQYKIKYSTNSTDYWNSTYSILWTTNTVPDNQESKIITGLEIGDTYYFWLKTADELGNWSEISNTATGYILPDTSSPTGNPSTPIDAGQYSSSTVFSFNWTNNTSQDDESGIAEYYLQVSTAQGGAISYLYNGDVGSIFTKQVTGITGKTYYARVKAKNGQGLYGNWSGWSDGIMVDTTAAVIAEINDGSGTDMDLSNEFTKIKGNWIIADNESGIKTNYYCIGTSQTGTNVVSWIDVGTSSYVIRTGLNLSNGVTHYISVKSENNAGIMSSIYSSDGIVIIDSSPAIIQNIRDGTGIDLLFTYSTHTLSGNWDNATDIESGILKYYYAIGISSGGTDTLNWTDIGLSTYIIRTGLNLSFGTTYFISVKVINGQGLESVFSSDGQYVRASNISGTTSTPTDTGIYSTSTILTFSWTAGSVVDNITGIVGYYLKVSTVPDESGNYIYNADVGNVFVKNVTGGAGKTYYSRVRAKNGQGLYGEWSGWSDGITVDTTSPVGVCSGLVSGYSDKENGFKVIWTIGSSSDDVSGIGGYWLQVSTMPDESGNYIDLDMGNVLMKEITGTPNEFGGYYARVKAKNGAGLYGEWSEWAGPFVIANEKPTVQITATVRAEGGRVAITGTAKPESTISQVIIKDQAGNVITRGIDTTGLIMNADGTISGNIDLGEIRRYNPLVKSVDVEIVARDKYGNLSRAGKSGMIDLSPDKPVTEVYNNMIDTTQGDKVHIRYELSNDEDVSIDILDLSGNFVKNILSERKAKGVYIDTTWDGKDEAGRFMGSGMYMVKIKIGNRTELKKVLIVQ